MVRKKRGGVTVKVGEPTAQEKAKAALDQADTPPEKTDESAEGEPTVEVPPVSEGEEPEAVSEVQETGEKNGTVKVPKGLWHDGTEKITVSVYIYTNKDTDKAAFIVSLPIDEERVKGLSEAGLNLELSVYQAVFSIPGGRSVDRYRDQASPF